MMRLLEDRPQRVTTVPYQAAAPGGGTEGRQLAVERFQVDALPTGYDAILAAGDLQGIAASPADGNSGLLGIAVADYLRIWADAGLLPPAGRVGVLLTGDLYSAPRADIRGASGPVSDVWLAFAAAGCPMVLGVAGNHDEVTAAQVDILGPDVALLDGDRWRHCDLTASGVSGVIGDPGRPWRRTEKQFHAAVRAAVTPPPDVLLLHEGPVGNTPDQRGNSAIRAVLERHAPALTLCGHVHWASPVSGLGDGHIINVDSRIAVLTAQR